jgi:LacI family transcriptional regulator
MAKPPTLQDVARLAGVSTSTAARVLRGAGNSVNAALSARVQGAAREAGYVPNVLARSLRGSGPRMVGLVVGDMLDPYYGAIADAVTRHAEAGHGMIALVCNMQRDPLLELRYCHQMWEHRVAGLILAGGGFDQWSHLDRLAAVVEQMTRSGIVVTTLSPRGLPVPAFCVDNAEVGELLAGHLAEAGHRRVGVVLGPVQNEVTQLRLRGIARRFAAAGVGFQVVHTDYSAEAGARAAQAMLAADPTLTGFVGGSDAMATGIVNWLRGAGHAVPQQVSVVGIGATRLAQLCRPSLVTVDVRLPESGRAALDFIAARTGGDAAGPQPIPPPRLMQGQSVAIAAACGASARR